MNETEELWTKVSPLLKEQVSEVVWYSTFNDVSAEVDDGTLTLLVPNTLVRDRILARYMPMISEALTELGEPSHDIVVEMDTNYEDEESEVGNAPVFA